MENHDDAQSIFPVQFLHQLHHFVLIGNIQKGCRFIQEQEIRLLGQYRCDPYPLGLAPGAVADPFVPEFLHSGGFHGPFHHCIIFR